MCPLFKYSLNQKLASLAFLSLAGLIPLLAIADVTVSGHILDINGNAIPQAMITLARSDRIGATAITVFSDQSGQFQFPRQADYQPGNQTDVAIRVLGYEYLHSASSSQMESGNELVSMTIIARETSNQAQSAPASAWLAAITDADEKAQFILDCIGCHQVPTQEVRAYASAIADIKGADPLTIRRQGWDALVKYMNFLSAEEFGRGAEAGPPDASRVYEVENDESVVATMSNHFEGHMDEIEGYSWGAPLAVTANTTIREYAIPGPNAIREALLLETAPGGSKKLFVADVASNKIFSVDLESGITSIVEVPFDGRPVGPHSLHRGADGSLWVAPFFSSVVAHLDTQNETWETWRMRTISGDVASIHDLSFGSGHHLLTDLQGKIWFSDIGNNSVGYLDPSNGDIETYRVPEIPGRPGNGAALYGLVMTSDRAHIWYSQLNIGSFGSYNIETGEFETTVQLPMNTGPRRLSISDDDILYIPLYGSGQLVEYDTKTNTQIGIYNLPDRASAPYAVTWDPVRKVVWIPTSNSDVIYKFDPSDKSFSVIPLPRTRAFLRMLDVDPDSGVLITAYANIVENVHGPRMALIIDPGDGAYQD